MLAAVEIRRRLVRMVAYASHSWLVSFANVSRDSLENDAKNVRYQVNLSFINTNSTSNIVGTDTAEITRPIKFDGKTFLKYPNQLKDV
jgi:hypothetical protein